MNGIFNFSLNKYDVFIFMSGVSSNFLNNVLNIYVVFANIASLNIRLQKVAYNHVINTK